MSLYIASLNSGSNGNSYYVANEREAVLIDAGLSCRETDKRMTRLGLSIKKVRAVFISHEHSDHIAGVEVISRKFRIPVYINKATLRQSRLRIEKELLRNFSAHEAVHIGSLQVRSFPKLHDAADPHSFVVSGNNLNIGVMTDIGKPCEQVIEYFRQCHAVFLEANYDESMLDQGTYPIYLKKRIKGDRGHMSNYQALDLFLKHRPPFMTHLLLSHLSKDNNHPDLLHQMFSPYANGMHISVASRFEESRLFHISSEFPKELSSRTEVFKKSDQLSLF